jgi:membrane-bound metal-dependent hydrolase YbcI (DUF457 family)
MQNWIIAKSGLLRSISELQNWNSKNILFAETSERVASSALGSIVHGKRNFPGVFETVDLPNSRQLLHSIVSAGLIAYAISGKHTLKLSRTTRLFLWAFGMSYLSHIALDCATPKRINLL